MNINIYFIFIAVGLLAIYVFFSPMKITINQNKNIPQLQLSNFTIYDLNVKGLKSIFKGTKGFRYINRYLVDDVNYTDNTGKYLVNITSKYGKFQQPLIRLTKNVIYKRGDGLIFKTQEGKYNQLTGIFTTNGKYVSYNKNNDKMTGYKLFYNSKTNDMTSNKIIAQYQLNEK